LPVSRFARSGFGHQWLAKGRNITISAARAGAPVNSMYRTGNFV
jgi:hypothetical protein